MEIEENKFGEILGNKVSLCWVDDDVEMENKTSYISYVDCFKLMQSLKEEIERLKKELLQKDRYIKVIESDIRVEEDKNQKLKTKNYENRRKKNKGNNNK